MTRILFILCASIDSAKNKADWYDPTIAKDDEFFRKQEHEKDKEKELNPSGYSWWQ